MTAGILVMKWGGELTNAGGSPRGGLLLDRAAAAQGRSKQSLLVDGLGSRCTWANLQVRQLRGCWVFVRRPVLAGLLRLHASYRHDLKIYSSDEGRVQMTAAAFAKGFLDLEGELTPILVGLVRRDGINALLDETQSAERGNHRTDLFDCNKLVVKLSCADLTSTKSTLYPLINSNTEASETLSTNSDKPIGTFRNLLDRIVSEVAAAFVV